MARVLSSGRSSGGELPPRPPCGGPLKPDERSLIAPVSGGSDAALAVSPVLAVRWQWASAMDLKALIYLERAKGFEPSTPTLARLFSPRGH
jgi:hypothetical protein